MKNLRMKSARVARDLSQQQLADLIGVSRQTISAIEKGDYNPTINLCIAICRELGKTLDELITMVSSKGGTTIAGLEKLRANNIEKAVKECCEACTNRAYELAKK